ncbi:MAG: hypothetical protein MdMp014T_2918 [Treponematales bacterium]
MKLDRRMIETALAAADAKLAEYEEALKRHWRAVHEAKARLNETLKRHLERAGFPKRMEINTLSCAAKTEVRVGFYDDHENSVTVNFEGRRVTSYFASGMCGRTGRDGGLLDDNIAQAAAYYAMAGKVMGLLYGLDFNRRLEAFFDAIDGFEYPDEVEGCPDYNISELRREKEECEEWLRIDDLGLKPGKVVEFFDRKHGYSRNGQWMKVEVISLTSKSMMFRYTGGLSRYEGRTPLKSELLRSVHEEGAAQ